ncbi:MAG: D-alanine-D-alanine ligase [Planctomycetota bacterium]|jgi:D-alanine-D-alanine ligase
MKKLRVLLLVHDLLLPPEDADELDWEETYPYQMELDVQTALHELGHEVEVLGVKTDLDEIRQRTEAFKPHVAFNILTDFHDITAYESHVVSYFELLKLPYTGCNPRGILLGNDKVLSKQIMIGQGVPCPKFASYLPGSKKVRLPKHMDYPVIVKSAIEHGSTGLSQASVVKSDRQLEKRVAYMFDKVGGEVIAEQFIPGREMTCSIVGNGKSLTVLPVWEVWFTKLAKNKHAICTEQLKWNVDYAQSIGIKTGRVRRLTEQKEKAVQKIARNAFKALGLSGYARVDMRMDADGNVYVIEANVNPDITAIEDFSEAAQEAGMTYNDLIQLILKSGIKYPAPWQAGPNKKYM